MNEFNHPATDKDDQPDISAIVQHEKPSLKYLLLEKQYVLGLNGPWLIGILIAATLAIWYLFGTTTPSSQDELALKTFLRLPHNQTTGHCPQHCHRRPAIT